MFRSTDGDLIGLRDEPVPAGHEPLLVPVMRDGQRTGPPRTLDTARNRFRADLDRAPQEVRRIEDPVAPEPAMTEALERLTREAREQGLERAGLS